ncbi:BTAD domain-containing putative transcriptional regulator [Nonomuraea sp. NPDC049152]|uniref:BTAD domain-containing putative transcriptional regulator n=1 Tax=Nonomuraea sp. NPDC049152 TaxID=3154350 RepID=UPI0033DE8285
MRFGVLGPLAVWSTEGRSVRIPEAKVRALLADLLAHAGRPVSADRLIEDLWGGSPPGKPAAALRVKVSQLRRVLEEAEPDGRQRLTFTPAGYVLRVDPGALDADRFEALTGQALASDDPAAKVTLLADALALWRGEPFADVADEEFVGPARARLAEQRMVAIEEQAEARLVLGEHAQLAAELADLVAGHPLRERLRAVQLRALYRAGRQSEALDSYARMRALLAEELGLDPGPELVALHQSILVQDPALDPAPATRTNLPVPMTGLIGRESATAEVRSLVASHRLVTLSGPGGVGKTRLALEVAAQLEQAHPDGVWLVELGARPSTVSVVDAIAAVMGVRDDRAAGKRGADATERLVDVLRAKRALLVLDNCEHVIDQVAAVAETLLRSAPSLRVLATSQEALAIDGERLWAVQPLDLPSGAGDPAASSAVRLFAARAAAAAPGFALDEHNAEAVAAICRRLDGLPLALELAASRMRVLNPAKLAERLDDRFRLLGAGRRDAPARQQTLRAMIDWSWELLTGAERVVLRRLAVHADGCTLEAAEAVCSGEGVRPADVLDLLARLVDRSLVVTVTGPQGTRYRLLESVAAYCLERMEEEAELDCVRRRHARHYLALAEGSDQRVEGQSRWLATLDTESANLRTALDTAAGQGAAEIALRLANAMARYFLLRCRFDEGRRALALALSVRGETRPAHGGSAAGSLLQGSSVPGSLVPGSLARGSSVPGSLVHGSSVQGDGQAVLIEGHEALRAQAEIWEMGLTMRLGIAVEVGERAECALAVLEAAGDPEALARAQWFLGFTTWGHGDLGGSEKLVGSSLATFETIGDRWGTAAALAARSVHAMIRGEFAAAERDGKRSAALFEELGDHWGVLQAVEPLAMLAEIDGDYDRAATLHSQGLAMAEELELWFEVSRCMSGLGRIALLKGDYARADDLHERARRLAAAQAHPYAQQFAEIGLALSARRQGRLDTAENHLRTWLDWIMKAEGEPGAALLLAELGFIAELRGDAELAMSLHRESHAHARATSDPRAIALALEGMAGAASLAGDHRRAARLLGAAAAAREAVGRPLPMAERKDVDRITVRSVEALDEELFMAEFRAGARDPVTM